MRTVASLFFFALGLAAIVGCSRGSGLPAAEPSPPTTPTSPIVKTLDPDVKSEPEPEPEPAPGELVKLVLPKEGGAWPWSVGTEPESPESRPVSFKGLGPYAANGFAVRPEVNRAVVSMRVDPIANGKKGVDPRKAADYTRVTLYDLSIGAAATQWAIAGNHTILDLSPDGRSILATHAFSGAERRPAACGSSAQDGQLKRWSCIAHKLTRDGVRTDSSVIASNDIHWAGFVGERIVSISRTGQVRVFDTEGLKPVATIEASPCRPAVTPDGTKVAFLVGPLVALLDPVARKITGDWVGLPPPHPALRFSPDGTKLAIGGNGHAVVLNLTTGHFQHLNLPKLDVNDNGVYDKPFGWAGPSYLFADSLLFDPALPQPVWEYSPAELVQFRGGRIWACTGLGQFHHHAPRPRPARPQC